MSEIIKNDQERILALEADLANAVLLRNPSRIQAILADDFYAVGHVGNLVNKTEYTAIHLAPERRFIKFETKEQKVKMIGTVAYVTGTIIVETKEIRNHSRYVTINQKTGDNWQIIFWQETPITNDKF
jgi:hypothetical protein